MKTNFRRYTVTDLVSINGLYKGQIYFSEIFESNDISFEIIDKDSNQKVIELSQNEIEAITSIFEYPELFVDDFVKKT